MRRIDRWLFGILLVAACHELPNEPRNDTTAELVDPAPVSTATSAPSIQCTVSWASGVDGDWFDGANWTGATPPTPSDQACIDAPGTYTVTLGDSTEVSSIKVGGNGSQPTLVVDIPVLSTVVVTDDVHIDSGATLRMVATNTHLGAYRAPGNLFFNDGTLEVVSGASPNIPAWFEFEDVVNNGVMDFDQYAKFIGVLDSIGPAWTGTFTNNGTIRLDHNNWSGIWTGTFRQQGGLVTGSAYLIVDGNMNWTGGVLEPLPPGSAFPRVSIVRSVNTILILGHSGLMGEVGVFADFLTSRIAVYGAVGPAVDLKVDVRDTVEFIGPFPNVRSVTNKGRLVLRFIGGTLVLPSFTNKATLETEGFFGGDVVFDDIVNQGTMDVVVDLDMVGTTNGSSLTNRGTITVDSAGSLEMGIGTHFIARGGSRMSGSLILDDATLRGKGRVGDVTSTGGNIEPGGSGIGTLTARSVTLDATSGLTIDIADTTAGSYDRLVVTRDITYGGTLTVTSVAPFVGGWCGQAIPIITDGTANPGGRGGFSKFNGLGQGMVNAWRVYDPPNEYWLVGYFTGLADVFVNASSLSVAEGGAPASYDICLGSSPPAADVVITPADVLGEVTHSGPVTFDVATWMLPRTVTVTPVDDAVIEPPHADTIIHTLASADPVYAAAPAGDVPVSITDNDGSADLHLAVVSTQGAVLVGDVFDIIYTVTNNGPTLSTGAAVVSLPLTGVDYVASAGEISCNADSDGVVNCTVPALGVAGVADLALTLQAVAAGSHPVTMTVTGQQPDPNAGNDTAVVNVTAS